VEDRYRRARLGRTERRLQAVRPRDAAGCDERRRVPPVGRARARGVRRATVHVCEQLPRRRDARIARSVADGHERARSCRRPRRGVRDDGRARLPPL